MAEFHGHLSRRRDRDLSGRGYQAWVRRGLLTLLVALPVCALLNVFGQRSVISEAGTPRATLTVKAPEHLRGGLVFEGRFEIEASSPLGRPKLVLGPGWTEGMTMNTETPQPRAETSDGGTLTLTFDPIPAGDRFTFWTQWQVNPVNVGRRSQDVALYDGGTRLASVDRDLTVFP
jgi:hypothetical protein